MRLLFDTNVFLEIVFSQPKASEAQKSLAAKGHERFISVFSLHSIGVLMVRNRLAARWPVFVNDMIRSGFVKVISLNDDELALVTEAVRRFVLDFDDAYQYVAAESHNLTIVSFDKDFDRTPRGRRKPKSITSIKPKTPKL
jgi:uncharacterized protein